MKQGPKTATFAVAITGVMVLIFLVNYFVSMKPTSSLSGYAASSTALYRDSLNPNDSVKDRPSSVEGEYGTVVITAPKGQISALVAEDEEQRKLGLGDRVSLGRDQGMLFVFEYDDLYGFWMKDMNFPLDIVWIDSSHDVVSIDRDISPDTYPKMFFPPSPVRYVLELNSGEADRLGIREGSSLTL